MCLTRTMETFISVTDDKCSRRQEMHRGQRPKLNQLLSVSEDALSRVHFTCIVCIFTKRARSVCVFSLQYAVVHYSNYWLLRSGVGWCFARQLCRYRSMWTALKEAINRQIITLETVIPLQRERTQSKAWNGAREHDCECMCERERVCVIVLRVWVCSLE